MFVLSLKMFTDFVTTVSYETLRLVDFSCKITKINFWESKIQLTFYILTEINVMIVFPSELQE